MNSLYEIWLVKNKTKMRFHHQLILNIMTNNLKFHLIRNFYKRIIILTEPFSIISQFNAGWLIFFQYPTTFCLPLAYFRVLLTNNGRYLFF